MSAGLRADRSGFQGRPEKADAIAFHGLRASKDFRDRQTTLIYGNAKPRIIFWHRPIPLGDRPDDRRDRFGGAFATNRHHPAERRSSDDYCGPDIGRGPKGAGDSPRSLNARSVNLR